MRTLRRVGVVSVLVVASSLCRPATAHAERPPEPQGLQECLERETAEAQACMETNKGKANCNTALKKGEEACRTAFPSCYPGGGGKVCDNLCVNLLTNLDNCGKCGNRCTGGQVCAGGKCACPTGATLCSNDKICHRLSDDPSSCGTCGNACSGGKRCVASQCICQSAVDCAGTCRNVDNDSMNCGACGVACAQGKVCIKGACACPPDRPNCQSTPPPGASPGVLPFDLASTAIDPNGWLLNPNWVARSNPAFLAGPSTGCGKNGFDSCIDAALACPMDWFGCLKEPKDKQRACFDRNSGGWQRCASSPLSMDSTGVCRFDFDNPSVYHPPPHHVGFRAATFTGLIEFADRSHIDLSEGASTGVAVLTGGLARPDCLDDPIDDDINWNLKPDGGAALAGRGVLHAEADYNETLAHFGSTFWKNFRKFAGDTCPPDHFATAQALIGRRPAIMSGLVDFDTQHGVHTELHPIYVLAINMDDRPQSDRWVIFVRNSGNRGACGHNQQFVNREWIKIRFPRPGATSVNEVSREFKSWKYSEVSDVLPVKDGAELYFYLGPPEDRNVIDGEITLNWSVPGAVAVAQLGLGGKPAPRAPEENEHPLADMPKAQLQKIAGAISRSASPPSSLDSKRVPYPGARGGRGPSAPEEAVTEPTLSSMPDPAWEQRERQVRDQVCKATAGTPKSPGYCAPQGPPAPAAPAINGAWKSSRGAMKLAYTPGTEAGPLIHVTGTWDEGGGKIGQLNGVYDTATRTITLRYFQAWNNRRGGAQLTVAAGGTGATGTFTDDSGGGRGGWTMNR